jgi:hypothetical protein
LIPWLRGIESTALDSTLATASAAKVTAAVLQIGMKRVTTTNPARHLRIDKSGTPNSTIRINANCFNAWERKILVLQVGKTRMHSPSPESQAVSAAGPASTTEAAVNPLTDRTTSIIPETPLSVMPLTSLDGFCALVSSDVLKRSIERQKNI